MGANGYIVGCQEMESLLYGPSFHHLNWPKKNLKFLLEQKLWMRIRQNEFSNSWAISLRSKYRPCAHNRVVDALSRSGKFAKLYVFSIWKQVQ